MRKSTGHFGLWSCSLVAVMGCATPHLSSQKFSRSDTIRPVSETTRSKSGWQRTPGTSALPVPTQLEETRPAIQPVKLETVLMPPIGASQLLAVPSPNSLTSAAPPISGYAIDLPSALAMTNASTPLVAFMLERVNEADAQARRAEVLWMPSIRAGLNYNKHEGRIQDVAGHIIETSRGSFYTGLGAQAVGAGSPSVPGLFAQFHVADAMYQPEIANQERSVRTHAAEATEHDAWLQTVTLYLDLLKAHQERAIATEALAHFQELERITGEYAKTGQGLVSDHERARTELAIRQNDVHRGEEGVLVAAAKLAQQLRIAPDSQFVLREGTVRPLELGLTGDSPQQLVSQGLTQRPETAEYRHLVAQATARLQREKTAPLLPSVLLGVSYGGLAGGLGSDMQRFGDRLDTDVAAFWEIRQFGFGETAARREAESRLNQARWREVATMDRIAREIVEAQAQVSSRRQQVSQAEQAISSAVSSFEHNRERVKNARGLPIEALQSIQALAQARREYLRAVTDYNTAQFTLHRALGWPHGVQAGS